MRGSVTLDLAVLETILMSVRPLGRRPRRREDSGTLETRISQRRHLVISDTKNKPQRCVSEMNLASRSVARGSAIPMPSSFCPRGTLHPNKASTSLTILHSAWRGVAVAISLPETVSIGYNRRLSVNPHRFSAVPTAFEGAR
jgi:hypothetical protein